MLGNQVTMVTKWYPWQPMWKCLGEEIAMWYMKYSWNYWTFFIFHYISTGASPYCSWVRKLNNGTMRNIKYTYRFGRYLSNYWCCVTMHWQKNTIFHDLLMTHAFTHTTLFFCLWVTLVTKWMITNCLHWLHVFRSP